MANPTGGDKPHRVRRILSQQFLFDGDVEEPLKRILGWESHRIPVFEKISSWPFCLLHAVG